MMNVVTEMFGEPQRSLRAGAPASSASPFLRPFRLDDDPDDDTEDDEFEDDDEDDDEEEDDDEVPETWQVEKDDASLVLILA